MVCFCFPHYVLTTASIANHPRALYEPPLTRKNEITIEHLNTLLPSGDEALASIGLAYEISRYSKNQVFLGCYPNDYFTEKTCQRFAAFDSF